MRNARPPVTPETDLSASQVNLMFWQLAGGGRTLPMAIFLYDGATPQVLFQALAFDPDGLLGNVPVVKNGTGDYTWTFASTYPDEKGVAQPYQPRAAMAFTQGAPAGVKANAFNPGIGGAGQDIQVIVRDAAELVTDATFLLAVW